MSTMDEYRAALKRLKDGRPLHVPVDSLINNDTVSMEAGRKKGSIKKSRDVFKTLIEEITAAALEKDKENDKVDSAALNKAKADAKYYQQLYFEGLEREISLVYEVYELQKRLVKYEPLDTMVEFSHKSPGQASPAHSTNPPVPSSE